MPNYNFNQKVNWRKIMEIQRWFLMMRKNHFKDVHITRKVSYLSLEEAQADLREDLELYQSLRKFLGNGTPAQIEKEIEELLVIRMES